MANAVTLKMYRFDPGQRPRSQHQGPEGRIGVCVGCFQQVWLPALFRSRSACDIAVRPSRSRRY